MSAVHVQRNWGARQRRGSGLLFVTPLGLLVVTGYLLYYVDADRPAALISSIHWIVGLCVPAVFLLHRGQRRLRGIAPVAPQPQLRPQQQLQLQPQSQLQAQLPVEPALPMRGLSVQPGQPPL